MGQYMKELKERRDIFVRGLNDLGLRCELPKATPYLWVRAPEGHDDEDPCKDKTQFVHSAKDEGGVEERIASVNTRFHQGDINNREGGMKRRKNFFTLPLRNGSRRLPKK
jgi:hypothetical protein